MACLGESDCPSRQDCIDQVLIAIGIIDLRPVDNYWAIKPDDAARKMGHSVKNPCL